MIRLKLGILFLILFTSVSGNEILETSVRGELEFKVFQFPQNAIPRIDGELSDWDIVPESYVYDTSLLNDTEDGHGIDIDLDDIDIQVTVGWVKGLSRLYIRYVAHDDFWDFERFNPNGYLNDIFEVVVDGDRSGGPFIFNPLINKTWSKDPADSKAVENYTRFSGNHAQNYHIYTPPVNNAWVLVWGGQPWISEFPHSNVAYNFDFQHGESGTLTMEFWITPFDYAPYEGSEQSVESDLIENDFIGLSWSILDFDGDGRDGHYNLAHNVEMVKDATYLPAFRLMPIEESLLPPLKAEWSFKVIDMENNIAAFKDESIGEVEEWQWDFGDGTTSSERNPVHQYADKNIRRVVTLTVKGANLQSARTRYWEVLFR